LSYNICTNDGVAMISLRRLTLADLDFGMRLKDAAGWNQTPADWRRLLALNPEGCFVALADGVRAGTVTGIPFGAMGWVGMMLVDPDQRRLGIGRALLKRILHSLEADCASVRLDATPLGKNLYDTEGFKDEYRLERRLRSPAPAKAPPLPPAADRDLPELLALDREAFGYDRSALLRALLGELPPFTAVARGKDGRLEGYLLARPGTRADFLGPWVARDASTAEALLQAAVAALATRPLFVDAVLPNPAAAGIATRLGFTPQREFIRMARGGEPYRENIRLTFGSAGPELG
jgi:GNAT superfamily N-acetyltransferase